MVAALTALIAPAFHLVTGWLHGRVQAQQAKQRLAQTITEAKIASARQREHDDMLWRVTALQSSGRVLKWVSFVIWSGPIVWAFVAPDQLAHRMSTALAVLPHWYVVGYLSITGTVWGFSHLVDKVGPVIAAKAGAKSGNRSTPGA